MPGEQTLLGLSHSLSGSHSCPFLLARLLWCSWEQGHFQVPGSRSWAPAPSLMVRELPIHPSLGFAPRGFAPLSVAQGRALISQLGPGAHFLVIPRGWG